MSITIFAAQAQNWHTRKVKVDTCTFRTPGEGWGDADALGPFTYLGNPLRNKAVVRLALQGPRGGFQGRVYFTKSQARELALALLGAVEGADD
jgi:hypothetical protein